MVIHICIDKINHGDQPAYCKNIIQTAKEANDCGHQFAAMGAVNYLFSVTINAKKKSMNIENIYL